MSRSLVCRCAGAMLCAFLCSEPVTAAEPAEIAAAIAEQDYAEAERLLDAALAATPDDPEVRFMLARVLGWQGRYDAALAEYDRLAEDFPNDVDYLLGRSRTNTWAGKDDAALIDLERAREIAPDYEAVWRLQYEVVLRAGKPEDQVALRQAAAERFPDAGWWRARGSKADYHRRMSFGIRHEDLSNGLPMWSQRFARVEWGQDGHRYSAAVTREARFGETDYAAALGVEWRLRHDWFSGMSLSVSPDSLFLPGESVAVHGGRRLAGGWGVDLSAQKKAYPGADVTIWSTGVERYFGSYRAAYTLYLSRLSGLSSSVGHLGSFGWYPAGPWSVALSVATGQEIEAVGPARVLKSEIESITLTARRRVTDRIGIEWVLGTHRQGDFYRRRYAGLALTYGF